MPPILLPQRRLIAGRWLYGLLFGALTVLLSGAGPHISIESVILAALLSSVFAPLIDVGTIWFNVYRRRRRYGST